MKKLSAILLACLLLVTAFSCGSREESGTETGAAAGNAGTEAAETEAETSSPFVADDLPDTLKYDGRTATFYIGDYMNAFWDDFYAETYNGVRLNDTIYDAIQTVNTRLDVSMKHIQDSFNWPTDQHRQRVTSSILAGDNSFDVLFSVTNFAAEQITSPYFLNLAGVPHIDLSKPWYNQSIPKVLPTGDVWFIIGDAGLGNVKHTFCVFFNQDLFASFGIDADPYALVDGGKWTLDAFTSIAKQAYNDVNGDATKDPGDNYGLTLGDNNKLLGFYSALGVTIFSTSDSGFTIEYGSERAVEVVQKLCALLHENEGTAPSFPNNADHPDWQVPTGGGNYASINFIEGRSLMSCSLVCDAASVIPEIDFSCGIVPYPKYDEAQAGYRSFLQRSCYSLIPTTADPEFSGALLEAWSSEAYRSVTPEYFEISLKTRYSQDNDASRMFDLIRSSVNFDLGEIFGNSIASSTPSSLFRENIAKNNVNWASVVASNESKWQEKLDELWDAMMAG